MSALKDLHAQSQFFRLDEHILYQFLGLLSSFLLLNHLSVYLHLVLKKEHNLQCRQFKLMTDNMNLYKTCFYTSFYILRKNKHNKNIVVKNYFTVYN